MRNLLNFLLKYNHWFLFVLLEVISLTLLFRFNNYQGSAFFTSANYLAGIVYEASSQVTRYFGLTEVNKDLTARNVELEIEVERLSQVIFIHLIQSRVLRVYLLGNQRLFDICLHIIFIRILTFCLF